MGAKNFETLLLQNQSRKFSNFYWIFFLKVLTKYVWLKFEIWNFFFDTTGMGPNGSENLKRYSYKSQMKAFPCFSWIFLPMVLTKLRWEFFKFLSFWF